LDWWQSCQLGALKHEHPDGHQFGMLS
jgi:hypothetical protein